MEASTFLMTSTFYPPYHIGGDAVHVKYLAEELVKRGHEVHVLHSIDAYNVKRKKLPAPTETNGVYIHPVKTHFNYSSYASYILGNSSKVNKQFENIVKEIKPNVVHHHNISLLGYNLLKKRGNYRNFYTAHDYWLICQQNNLLKNRSQICHREALCFLCALRCKKTPQIWRLFDGFKLAIKNVDAIIAPSAYVSRLFSQLGIKVVKIPNFVPEPPYLLEPPGVSNFFLYAGILERHKGIQDLLEIYKEKSGEIDPALLIVGDGSLHGEIRKFVKGNNLQEKVVILGRVDQYRLFQLLRDANALVMPSIWPENCPLIALESLSTGTPIITSKEGGLPEITEKVDSSLFYKSKDDLKQILTNFRSSDHSRYRIKKAYRDNYSPQVFLKKYFELVLSQ
jgi:glycosyltransferase involved in cell wall biosynthesis